MLFLDSHDSIYETCAADAPGAVAFGPRGCAREVVLGHVGEEPTGHGPTAEQLGYGRMIPPEQDGGWTLFEIAPRTGCWSVASIEADRAQAALEALSDAELAEAIRWADRDAAVGRGDAHTYRSGALARGQSEEGAVALLESASRAQTEAADAERRLSALCTEAISRAQFAGIWVDGSGTTVALDALRRLAEPPVLTRLPGGGTLVRSP